VFWLSHRRIQNVLMKKTICGPLEESTLCQFIKQKEHYIVVQWRLWGEGGKLVRLPREAQSKGRQCIDIGQYSGAPLWENLAMAREFEENTVLLQHPLNARIDSGLPCKV
jgi:hypothetical protein